MTARGMMPASPFSTAIMCATRSKISCGPLMALAGGLQARTRASSSRPSVLLLSNTSS